MLKPSRILFWALVVAAVLRIYGLGSESLWFDETRTVWRATEVSFSELNSDAGDGSQLPLYYWISKIWVGWFGTGEFWLRFPAMVFGVLSVLLVYHLGRKLFSAEAGMWAAIFMAINPFLIHYSQEARPYTLFMLTAMISWYFLLQLLRTVRISGIVGYAIFTAAALYSHAYGSFLLLTHLAGWLIYRRVPGYRGARREWKLGLLAPAGALLIFLPQLIRMINQFRLQIEGSSSASWIPEPSFIALFHPLNAYFADVKLSIVVYLVLLITALPRALMNPKVRPAVLFCASAGLILLFLPWLISVTVAPIYVIRYTIPFLPLLLILLGWAVSGLELLPRRIVVAVLVLLTAWPVYTYSTRMDKTPWREATTKLEQQVRAGDLVIWYPWWVKSLPDHYFTSPGGVKNLYLQNDTQLAPALQQARRVWLIGIESRLAKADSMLSGQTPRWQMSRTIPILKDAKVNPYALDYSTVYLKQYLPAVDPTETLTP